LAWDFKCDRSNLESNAKEISQEILLNRSNKLDARAILSFFSKSGELFHETWERLMDLLRKCPHHVVPKWQLMQYFYVSLSEPHCQMVDASCGGTFMTKNEDVAWELFNTMSDNFMHHASISRSDRFTPTIVQKKSEVCESGHLLDIHSKVDLLTQKLDQILSMG